MDTHDLVQAYQSKTDEELLQLAADPEQLTPEAQSALTSELAKRRLDGLQHLKFEREIESEALRQTATRGTVSRNNPHATGDFIAEVIRVYHGHFWLFIKFVAPAVVLGYIAVQMGRNEVREIARHLPRGFEFRSYQTFVIEIWLATLASYLASWMVFCFLFGGICSATRQIDKGTVPSPWACFGGVRENLGSLTRLSLLLFFLVLLALAAANLLGLGLLWAMHLHGAHFSFFTIGVISYALGGLILLVVSRFALAIPALILDNCGVGQSMFRSDELTEGKWLTLAILLAKSLIGGYVAGMFPFWLARWLSADVWFPPWLLRGASVAAVTVIEPVMFIGFALLYIRTSALPPATNEPLPRQLT
jgi:hypothetical protein